MTDKTDRHGTVWDWPVPVMIAGVLLCLLAVSNGAGLGVLVGLLVAGFGLVALLARRGSFSPRGD
jgi:hypothetical protein